jgi:hypothetical protein
MLPVSMRIREIKVWQCLFVKLSTNIGNEAGESADGVYVKIIAGKGSDEEIQ